MKPTEIQEQMVVNDVVSIDTLHKFQRKVETFQKLGIQPKNSQTFSPKKKHAEKKSKQTTPLDLSKLQNKFNKKAV